MSTFDPHNFEPVKIGPSWQTDEDGQFILPELTLGFECLQWTYEYLKSPNGGPWTYTPEQARLVCWWYALDKRGRFTYSDGVIQRVKGAGKDPFAAALAAFELCGPCRFSHWGPDGKPVGKQPHEPWIQIAAVSREQTKNTMKLFPGLFNAEAKKRYDLKIGRELIHSQGGLGRIEAVTSSPATLEGGRPSLLILNEALALDTPIPTPNGWTTMGALETGDRIFGSDGKATTVTEALPVQHGRKTYEVYFQDGTSVVASDGHLWSVYGSNNPTKLVTLNTEEMANSGRNYWTPRPGPRRYGEVVLPVDPYLLGAWLGDGSTGACNITAADDDAPVLQASLLERGIETHLLASSHGKAQRVSFSNRAGFQARMGPAPARALRALPCFRDKHVPAQYLTASIEQRTELLRGLMDTDGCATKDGYCIFVGRKRLAEDVLELLRSLGQVAHIAFAADDRSRDGGCYRVGFAPFDIQPFSFSRKAARVKPANARRKVRIGSITEVPSVPVRCIAVDAEDRLFQAGPSGHVTHNTHWWVKANEGHDMALTGRANCAKVGGRAMAITNAPQPGMESVAEQDRRAYEDVLAGRAMDVGTMYDSLEAPPGAPLTVEAIPYVLARVRGDAYWLDVERTMREILDSRTPASRSRRFYYNQIVASEDALILPDEWDGCRVTDTALSPGDEIVLGLDGGKSDDSTALVAIRISDRFAQPLGVWEKPRQETDPPWEVDMTLVDDVVGNAFATYAVRAFFSDVHPIQSYVDKWSDEYRDTVLIKAAPGKSAIGFDMRGNNQEITRANEFLVGAIRDGQIHHAGHPVLREHALNTFQRPNRWGMSFGKESRESLRKVDAYAALLLAFIALNKYLESGKKPDKKSLKRGWFL